MNMKMKKFLGTTLLAASVAASFQALASQTTDLNISGVIANAACDTSFDRQIEFGDIENKTLNSSSGTNIPSNIDPTFNIVCPAPMLIGVRLTDNRAATKAPHMTGVGVTYGNQSGEFGLNVDSLGNNIGYWIYRVLSTTVDGGNGQTLRTENGGSSWVIQNNEWGGGGSSLIYSFNKPTEGIVPSTVTTVGMKLNDIRAIIVPREQLNTSTEINLDGSVTFELFYF